MALTSTRASTQDNTSGVTVASAVNEDAAGTLQANVLVGSKTTFSEVSRTAITAVDSATDLSTVGFAGSSGANLFDLGNALAVQVRATCSVASATLSGRLVFYDGSNAPIGLSEAVTFTSDATRRLSSSGDYLATRVLVDAGSARKARIYVESVSSGTWAISCRPL